MTRSHIEPWEKPKIRKLQMAGSAGGIAGMAAILGISLIFRAIRWGHVSAGILFIPWMVVLILLIPTAYHQGVCEERERGKEEE